MRLSEDMRRWLRGMTVPTAMMAVCVWYPWLHLAFGL